MKLKKNYRFDNKRQIWRVIPTNEGKLIIEERDTENKQVYFHCLSLDSGKKIFSHFQLDDKFWVGIEAVQDDIIFFHKFAKPDMPKHRGIFAYDFAKKELVWQNPELIFLFILNHKLYAYKEKFEGRNYYSIDSVNGEILEDIGENYEFINNLRNESSMKENHDGYLFPETLETGLTVESPANEKNQLLMMSFHEANSKGTMTNLFKAVDLSTGKYILEEVINKETSLFLTDSFFVKDNLLFLLFGKTRLEVFTIVK